MILRGATPSAIRQYRGSALRDCCQAQETIFEFVPGANQFRNDGQLVSALKAWKLQSRFSKPEDLIFANRQGGYVGHDNLIKRQFLPLIANVKAKRFNWHGLRHFAVSTWIEAGLSPKTVQTFAGHASLQVTMDRYGHLFPSEDHKRAMDRIGTTLFTRTLSEH